jgi:hypothetical protein
VAPAGYGYASPGRGGTRVRGTAPYACENARIALSAAVEIADNEIPLPVLIRGTDYLETDAIAERAERPARKPAPLSGLSIRQRMRIPSVESQWRTSS